MKKLLISFALILFTVFSVHITAQTTYGCTDQKAKNYDAGVTVNDGSCVYKPVIYNPPFKYILPDEVKETSGLIYYDETLWTINDSGNPPILYKLDPITGSITGRIRIENAENHDWEALAQDQDFIYIGDFGNNKGNRKNLQVIKIAKKDLPDWGNGSINALFIKFSYPDYPGNIDRRKNNNFDCESLICIDDSLYLFSKDWGNSRTRLYSLPTTEGEYSATLLGEFDSRGLITGADYNDTTGEVILVGYTNKTWLPFLWLLYDYHDHQFFSGNKRRIDMLNLTATQTEGIAFTNAYHCVITSEGRKLFSQTAYDLNAGKWFGDKNLQKNTEPEITATPNPITGKYLYVKIEYAPKGTYTVKLVSEKGALKGIKVMRVKKDYMPEKVKFKTKHLKRGNYRIQVITDMHVYDLKCLKR